MCESVHKGFLEMRGIVDGSIFYETKTKISDFMRMSHTYGDNGMGCLECGLYC